MVQVFIDSVLLPSLGNLLLAMLVFVVGQVVIRVLLRLIERLLKNRHLDEIFITFAGRVSNILLQILLIGLVLIVIGVNPAYLFALFGVIGLALIFAFQESLQNFAGGILLLAFTPFHAGDELELENHKANVREIGIFNTRLTTKDNREVIIPNASFLTQVIVNNSANPIRRVDLVVRIGYEADLMVVRDTLWSLIIDDPRILNEPEPKVTISELAESSVKLNVRPWVLTADHGNVKDDLREKIKLAFDEHGIQIPYPRLDISTADEMGKKDSDQVP